MTFSLFGKPPPGLEAQLDEASRQTFIAYSDDSLVRDLKASGGKIKKAGKIISLITGDSTIAEAGDGISKITSTAAEIGSIGIEFEHELGIDTTGVIELPTDNKTHTTSHEHGDDFIVAEQHAPSHPVPNSGSTYTYIPVRPSHNNTSIMSTS